MDLDIHVTPPWNAIGSESQKKEEKKEKEKKKKKLGTVRLRRCLFPSSFYRQTLAPFTLH